MCSINGVFSSNNEVTEKDVLWSEQSQKSLKYRGPDESGEYRDGACILSVNRFKITGLENGGEMPIKNESGSIQVILNGEIYNYKELRSDLVEKGHAFKSNTDTEVIAHSYEEYGAGCFEKFIGMFAVAIYDNKNKKIVLARDRFGEKPLFYIQKDKKIYFASESKVLANLTDRKISKQALAQFLILNSALDHIVEGIQRLRPGHYLEFDNKGINIKKYWEPEFSTDYNLSFREAAGRYHQLLSGIVGGMIPLEVRFGSFISGGIDSALISFLLERQTRKNKNTNGHISLVTSGLNDPSLKKANNEIDLDYAAVEESGNELAYTRLIADSFKNASYFEREFSLKDFLNSFNEMVSHLPGGPVISTSFPLYWFSAQEARSNDLRVCLCGEGADELFGGYRTGNPDEGYGIGTEIENFIRINGTFGESEMKDLVGEKLDTGHIQDRLNSEFRGDGKEEDVLFNRIRFMLSSGLIIDKHMLEKSDGVTMAAPVEVRAPFLSKDSAEFAFSLPKDFCISGDVKKKFLKEVSVIAGVPEQIIKRRKQRTSLPYYNIYYQTEFGHRLREQLKNDGSKIGNYLDRKMVENIVENSQNNPKRIHALAILESWLDQFANG